MTNIKEREHADLLPQKRSNGDPWRDFRVWSIAIYQGASPFDMSPASSLPVLTAKDVTDCEAAFVADPFMLKHANQWHMYFEVLLKKSRKGVISKALSDDAINWRYQGIVLEEDFHLSYPCIFQHENNFYLVPETLSAGAIRLYKTPDLSSPFTYVCDLIPGKWADATVFYSDNVWWLFACSTPYQNNTLELFYSHELEGPWLKHPHSPIVNNNKKLARPGGRIIQVENKWIRLAQDCEIRYGNKLRAIEITELTTKRYSERALPNPVLVPEKKKGHWHSAGMHHMDAHQLDNNSWIACVDGDRYVIPDELLESEMQTDKV